MKKLLALMTLTLLTFSATAREIVVNLPINGEYYSSQTFRLKKLIKQQRPGLNLNRAKLDRVELKFKSKRGADLTLRVGQDHSTEFVRGYRRDYNYDRGQHVTLFGPRDRYDQQGRWQLDVNSRREYTIRHAQAIVRVRDVVRPRPVPRPGRFVQTCGYVRETIWGTDLEKYFRDARGDSTGEALDRACEEARNACWRDANSFIEVCKKL